MKKWLSKVYYSFPIQLFVLHFKCNLLFLSFWLIFLLILSGKLGLKLGLQYLFLDPEYLGMVNFWSFYFIGLSFGGLVMSWSLTTYLLNAHRFPFLATLERPFTKFSLNNFIIPLSVFIIYLVKTILFQSREQSLQDYQLFLDGLGLLFGTLSLILFYSIYFHFTNRDITYYQSKANNSEPSYIPGNRKVDINFIKQDQNRWRVRTYLTESLQSRLVRSVAHYDANLIRNIFRQNHLNALIIQLGSMLVLVVLGYLFENPSFRIPAGASLLILLSFVIAVLGAISYWFNEWRIVVIVGLLFGLNLATTSHYIQNPNKAFGLDYESTPVEYTYPSLKAIKNKTNYEKDKQQAVTILNNWNEKLEDYSSGKPKMIIFSVSGGGLKSALWTMKVMQSLDQITQGALMQHTALITGASGGMIGAAYYRELFLQTQLGNDIDLASNKYLDRISKDLLNSVAFAIVSQDLFIPWSRVSIHGQYYHKDRGYIFERQLNENTGGILDKTICEYKSVEQSALIPMIIVSPSIVNDARRLLISPHPVSYLMAPPASLTRPDALEIDAVDFHRLFHHRNGENLSFLSALRMNATYPYVLPNVHLPTSPEIEVMDAGFLDNYGLETATRFIHVFKDWINQHTSGVLLIQVSSSEKIEQIYPSDQTGFVESLLHPLGIAGKLFTLQEYDHDNSLGFLFEILDPGKFEVIRFIYKPSNPEESGASISFHVTQEENKDIINAFSLPSNQHSLRTFLEHFGPFYKQNPRSTPVRNTE